MRIPVLALALSVDLFISHEALAQQQGPLVVCQSGNYAVSVTPDGTGRNWTQYTVSRKDTFTVRNTSVDCSATYLLSHTETGPILGVSLNKVSVTLNPGAATTVIATYDIGSPGSGVLTLKAVTEQNSSIWDTGYFSITVVTGAPTNWDVTPFNHDNQVVGRCAAACFAATYAQSTVPYFSLDAPRNATLLYNGDRVWPKPFIHLNVQKPSGTPDTIFLQVKKAGVWQTFINGDSLLKFLAASSGWQRIGGQLRDSTWATGMYTVDLIVTWHYPGGSTTVQTWTTKLLVVNEASSAIARGWILGGIPRIYPQPDSSVLLTEGDGSAVFFRKRNTTAFFAPAGEFSTLVVNGTGWKRLYPDSTKVFFNSAGRPTDIYDRFNNRMQFLYDGSNRLTTIKDPDSLDLVVAYGSFGLSSIRDNIPPNRYTNITVPSDSTLTAIQDPDGVSTRFQYDGSRRLWKVINRRGDTTALAYQTINGKNTGKLASITAPLVLIDDGNIVSPVTSFVPWHTIGVPYSISPVGVIIPDTVYGRVTDPGSHTSRFTVNRWGTPAVAINASGRSDSTRFNLDGLPIRVRSGSGSVDSAVYNASGLPTFVQTADATNRRTMTYNAGWALPDSAWGGSAPSMRAFVANGHVDSVRSAGFSMARFVYDTRGRLVSSRDGRNKLVVKHFFNGANGNTSQDSMAGGWMTTYYYDALGRDTAVKRPETPTRRTHFDVLNRPIAILDGVYATPTTTAFDSLGHVTSVNAKGQVHGFTYNALGWVIAKTDPVGLADSMWYSRDGELRRVRNRRGQIIAMTYNADHSRVSKAGSNTDSLSWGYTLDGRVDSARSPLSTEIKYFNVRGQLDSVKALIAGQTFWRRYHYTTKGIQDSVKVSGGGITFRSRGYTTDTTRFLLSKIALGGPSAGFTSLTYDSTQSPTSRTYRGAPVVWQYDDRGQLGSITSTALFGDSILNMLSHDGEGRLTMKVDQSGTRARKYTYDGLGRLWSDSGQIRNDPPPDCDGDPPPVIGSNGSNCVTAGDWQTTGGVQFSYDSLGNRTDDSGTYGAANRIQSFSGCTYVTDVDGNVTSRRCSGDTTRFAWSAEGLLDTIVVHGLTLTYHYDAQGRVVRKDSEGTPIEHFLWEGANLLAELTGSGTAGRAEFSYFPGFDNPHAIVAGGVEYDAQTDAVGSVVALTDSAQNIRRYYYRDAWGNSQGATGDVNFNGADRIQFKGSLFLGDEAGLYYMRARWYEPGTGRFLSEDPIGLAGGTNSYTYARNDPVNLRDTDGLLACSAGVVVIIDDVFVPCTQEILDAVDSWLGSTHHGLTLDQAWAQSGYTIYYSDGRAKKICPKGFGAIMCEMLSGAIASLVAWGDKRLWFDWAPDNLTCFALGLNAMNRFKANQFQPTALYINEGNKTFVAGADGYGPTGVLMVSYHAFDGWNLPNVIAHEEFHLSLNRVPAQEDTYAWPIGKECGRGEAQLP